MLFRSRHACPDQLGILVHYLGSHGHRRRADSSIILMGTASPDAVGLVERRQYRTLVHRMARDGAIRNEAVKRLGDRFHRADAIFQLPLLKCPRLRDGSPIAGYIEHSVGFHVKIAIPGLGVHMRELPPLFHIESYGLEGRIEHAGVGGE